MNNWWSKDRFLNGACSIFSLAVWLYPADFRLRFGPEMILTLRENLQARFPSGFFGIAEFLGAAMADTLWTALVFRGEESAWLKSARALSSRRLGWASLMVLVTVLGGYCFLVLLANIAPHFYLPETRQPVERPFWSQIYLPRELLLAAVLVGFMQQAAFLRRRLWGLDCKTAGPQISMDSRT